MNRVYQIYQLIALASLTLPLSSMEPSSSINSNDQIEITNRTGKEIELFFEATGKQLFTIKPNGSTILGKFNPTRNTLWHEGKQLLPSPQARSISKKTGKITYTIFDHYNVQQATSQQETQKLLTIADNAYETTSFPASITLSNQTNAPQQFELIDHALKYFKIMPNQRNTFNVKNVDFIIGYDAEIPSDEDPMFLELTGIPLVKSPLFPPKVVIRSMIIKNAKGRPQEILKGEAYQEPQQQKKYNQ